MAGALDAGLAGVAGASTGSTANTGAAITSSTTVCSLLPQIQTHVQKVEAQLAAALPKAQAAEAKAKAAEHGGRRPVTNRVTKVQDRETRSTPGSPS